MCPSVPLTACLCHWELIMWLTPFFSPCPILKSILQALQKTWPLSWRLAGVNGNCSVQLCFTLQVDFLRSNSFLPDLPFWKSRRTEEHWKSALGWWRSKRAFHWAPYVKGQVPRQNITRGNRGNSFCALTLLSPWLPVISYTISRSSCSVNPSLWCQLQTVDSWR